MTEPESTASPQGRCISTTWMLLFAPAVYTAASPIGSPLARHGDPAYVCPCRDAHRDGDGHGQRRRHRHPGQDGHWGSDGDFDSVHSGPGKSAI
jgi:hypothetical protein